MVSNDAKAVRLASGQDGLVTQAQLRDAGLSARVVRRLRASGVLHQASPQVLILPGLRLAGDRRLRAALLQAGPMAALSHASAAAWWSAPRVGGGAVEVMVRHGTTVPAGPIGRVHVSRNLRSVDVRVERGMRVTSPRRTVLDLAPRLGRRHLGDVLRDFERRGLLDLGALGRELGLVPHRGMAGVVRLEALVDAIAVLPLGDSWLADEFISVLDGAGRRLPETQVPFTVDGHDYVLDTLWRAERFVVELDGQEHHSSRVDRRKDAERAARITGCGYGLVRFTYEDVVGRPDYCLEVVDHHLAVRRPD